MGRIAEEEREKVDAVIDELLPAVECIVTGSIDLAMNKFNPKKNRKRPVPVITDGEASLPQEEMKK